MITSDTVIWSTGSTKLKAGQSLSAINVAIISIDMDYSSALTDTTHWDV